MDQDHSKRGVVKEAAVPNCVTDGNVHLENWDEDQLCWKQVASCEQQKHCHVEPEGIPGHHKRDQ